MKQEIEIGAAVLGVNANKAITDFKAIVESAHAAAMLELQVLTPIKQPQSICKPTVAEKVGAVCLEMKELNQELFSMKLHTAIVSNVSGVKLCLDDLFYADETGQYHNYSVFMKFKDGTVNPNFETALDSLMDILVTCRKGDASTKDEKHKKRAFFDFVRDNGHRKMQTEVQHKKLRR
jgi:hypothetical protein